jgi:hypothetical protein
MSYLPDLSRLSLDDYKEHLKSIDLLPSRRVLLDCIDEKFSAIVGNGISDVQALIKAISTPAKLTAFSQTTMIDLDYLKILKREIGGLIPKAIPLSDFDILSSDDLHKLNSAGLRNSKDYFEAYPNIENSIFQMIDCEKQYQLCGLVRVNGIGPLAAKIFLEAGYANVEDIAAANAEDMVGKINDINSLKKYYNGQLGIKDMRFCIVHAQMLKHYA